MSVAVRVSVWILGLLVIVSAAVAVLALMQKQTLQGQNQSLQSRIADDASKLSDITSQVKKLQDQASDLSNKITQAQQDKAQTQSLYDDLKKKSDDMQSQLDQANTDRDSWKSRVQTVSRERDDLIQKLKNQPTQVIYKDRIVQAPAALVPAVDNTPAPVADINPISPQSDQYWADVLKQKAALQIELQRAKFDLDQAALQVVDLKKQNSDLSVQLKEVSNEKDEIIEKIKYGQDLADNLSIDLARSRNDQQMINDHSDKLKQENLQLLSQIRDLSSAKLQLEQTVARLTDDKDAMQRKLVETQSVIQSRIDDIWKIKENLDKKLAENSPSATPEATSTSGSMELPPIIVNAPTNTNNQQYSQQQYNQQQPAPVASAAGKTEGTIISINESNNFVIADLGQQNSSVTVGTALRAYRGSDQIASLEVIQVRRDICAADIKDKSTMLKVGDIVKFN